MATAKARGGALGPDDLFLLEPTPCPRATPHQHTDPPAVASPWVAGEIQRMQTMSDLELVTYLEALRMAARRTPTTALARRTNP